MSAVARYYNDMYATHELDLDEQGNTFEKISRLWRDIPGKTALDGLDIGCGAGSVSEELVRRGHWVRGLDIMEEAIARARQRGIEARVHDLDRALPFSDGSFDFVLALDIVEHVFDPLALLTEIRRVLRPSGFAIIMIPLHFDLRQRVRMLRGRGVVNYEHLFYDKTCSPWTYFHIRLFTLQDVYDGLARSRLRIERQVFRPMIATGWPGIPGVIERMFTNPIWSKYRPSLFSSGVSVRVHAA